MTAPPHSLRGELERAIDELPDDQVSVGGLIDRFGAKGMLLLVILLTLVFLIPVSVPGVSTVFGAAILMVGFSRLLGRPPWLPRRLRDRPIRTASLRPALSRGLVWVRRLEKISRPGRVAWLSEGRVAECFNDLALVLGAVLLMAPFGFIPFSNTLPGLALLLLATGSLQRDGLAILLGHLANLATLAYFAVLIGGGGLAARELLQRF